MSISGAAGSIFLAALLLLTSAESGRASEGEPSVDITQLLEEAGALAQEARELHARAQGMGPSVERNEVLSKVSRLTKAALGKYEVASEASLPSERIQAETTDLRGMLFWCHKSMVVVIPDARPELPSPEKTGPVGAPMDLASPGAPRPLLLPAELADVQVLLAALVPLFEARELHEDKIASCREQMGDVRSVMVATRTDWEGRMARSRRGDARSELAAFESKRGKLLASIRDRHATIRVQESALRELDPRIKALTLRLEFYRDRAIPDLVAFAQARAGGVPEALVGYVNRQLASPSFGFTPIPSERKVFPETPEGVKAVCKLLDELSRLQIQMDGMARMVADSKAASDAIKKDVDESRAHQAWLNGKLGVATLDKTLQREQEQLRAELVGLAQKREKCQREILPLQAAIDRLRDKLRDMPPDMALAVEKWRRRQESLPMVLHETLEVWTRRALRDD